MPLGWWPGILLYFQFVIKLTHFCLQLLDDHLVFAVDLGLVVTLAAIDGGFEIFDELPCLPIQVLQFGRRVWLSVAYFLYAWDDFIQVQAIGFLRHSNKYNTIISATHKLLALEVRIESDTNIFGVQLYSDWDLLQLQVGHRTVPKLLLRIVAAPVLLLYCSHRQPSVATQNIPNLVPALLTIFWAVLVDKVGDHLFYTICFRLAVLTFVSFLVKSSIRHIEFFSTVPAALVFDVVKRVNQFV